jgi:tetratricopeptide (TPR) repeat protein
MKVARALFQCVLLTGLLIGLANSSATAQVSPPEKSQVPGPSLRKVTIDDDRSAQRLDEQIDKALNANRWDEAIARTKELIAVHTRVHGPNHFETLNAQWRLKKLRAVAARPKNDQAEFVSIADLNDQSESLFNRGLYAEAQRLDEKVLEIRRRLFDDEHPDIARSYGNIAADIKEQGKYAAAQPLFEKALEITRHVLGDNHPDTASNYANLAVDLMYQGKSAAAQPFLEKALEIRRRLFTDFHVDTAHSLNILAGNLNSQGKYAAAQPFYEKVLAVRRRLLGEDHAKTASSYNSLGWNLHEQGNFAKAKALFEKGLEIRRRLLTDDHPETANSYKNLAENLMAQGRYAEAQPLYEKALQINRRLLTDDHPVTAQSYNDLAHVLDAQGKHAESQPLLEKALALNRRLLGDDHPNTAGSYNNLALNLDSQRKYSEAEPLLERALAVFHRRLSDDHPNTAAAYGSLGSNLAAQAKYAKAQSLFEKSLEITRRLQTENHPHTATSYNNVAMNLNEQGKYAIAEPLLQSALEIRRRLLGDDHPYTAQSYANLATNLRLQGRHVEARDLLIRSAHSFEASRLMSAFTGLDRATAAKSADILVSLAAVLFRLGDPSAGWQRLEEHLGRGLLDELAARQDSRLTAAERARLRELISDLERLDMVAESTSRGLDDAERTKRLEGLKYQRELASIALGEFRTKLVAVHKAMAGQVAKLNEIQAALPGDTALVAWVDIPPAGSNAADPDGEHWGVVVRSKGIPACIPIAGTGKNGLWTTDDTGLANRVKGEFRAPPAAGVTDFTALPDRLRAQRLAPLAKALGTTIGGLPSARRLIVLPSRAMAGIPIEALLAPDDTRTVSYAPSGTVFRYLREQPRSDHNAGLLALSDPAYAHPDKSGAPKPVPDCGLMVNVVAHGSNAANHGLKNGDVLLSYNARTLHEKDDLKVVTEGDKPIPIEVWRDGISFRQELAPGKLGVGIDPRPAREAITENRKLQNVLVAARSGGEQFVALPGTRREVEGIAQLFKSGDRPAHALLGTDASEPELDRLASARELRRFAFIHLATHGVIDEATPQRSAVILTQTGLPDPLEQVLNHKPAYDGRLSVREIQHDWDLKAELVTLSACDTALGREAGGEGFVGFTQALLMSGARTVCLSLWKVDDTATALLMTRFYQNMLAKRPGLSKPMAKAEALCEAKQWLRRLTTSEADTAEARLPQASRGAPRPRQGTPVPEHPYQHPHFWAAFILTGDAD